jgi:2-iminobutanoate/2-iminopropanoate deaminase
MPLSIIETHQAPAAIGPYAQAIDIGSLIFVSGQLGLDPVTGQLVGDSLEAQARQALSNLLTIVRAGGSAPDRVVAVDVFLIDMDDFTQFNAIYQSYFQDHTPARAVVAVKALPKGACVEIKCVAQK